MAAAVNVAAAVTVAVAVSAARDRGRGPICPLPLAKWPPSEYGGPHN